MLMRQGDPLNFRIIEPRALRKYSFLNDTLKYICKSLSKLHWLTEPDINGIK